jgi:hypothetical protein
MFLQTRLDDFVAKEAAKERIPESRMQQASAATLLLASYADALGDKLLRDEVLKVGEAVNVKKYKEAADLAKKLVIKPGKGPVSDELQRLRALEARSDKNEQYLIHTASLFRPDRVGGLNIERDLMALVRKKDPAKIDPEAVELIAVRTAVISQYTFNHPTPEVERSPANLMEWLGRSRQSAELSRSIIGEVRKGKDADEKKVRELLTRLRSSCDACHEKFRD